MKLRPEDLEIIKERVLTEKELTNGKNKISITVHMGTCGIAAGAQDIYNAFKSRLEANPIADLNFTTSGCVGICSHEPMATIEVAGKDPVKYMHLDEKKVGKIFDEHVVGGKAVIDYALGRGFEGLSPIEDSNDIPDINNIDFFKKQKPIVLLNRGVIDPESLDEYIARDGYKGALKAITEMSSEKIIDEVIDSGLRGRGGAGFKTGLKWRFAFDAPGDEKYIICNADEGDPGAFMDRSVVESDPHAVIEGMLIGAKAIGASKGFIYIRDEYPMAVRMMRIAIEKAKEAGLLGEDIFDTDFSFDLSISRGAGAFVCGEETSLINSLEGKLPEPRVRPPFPANSGYMQKPTNINNVESWATIKHIINNGSKWFSSLGTEESKGTKIFSLVGKVNNTGLVEVPMGMTIREIVEEIGNGVPNGKKAKAVQSGGPSGGCIPEHLFDTSVDYESLAKVGAIVGSGGMIVMDEDSCMVELARYFLTFTQGESCGKCTPCREGTRHMLDILTRITEGKGKEGDIEILEKMARLVKDGSLCALGGTAPNPILTTIRYFRDEYEAHIKDGKCPAKECKALINYEINKEACTGCTLCAKNCPVNCIAGTPKELHIIDKEKCIKCGVCKSVCSFNAVEVNS